MGSAPATDSLADLKDSELLVLLPQEKIYKAPRKCVQITRTPEECAVINELWRRYQIHRIRKETGESVAFLCPTKITTVGAFEAKVLKNTWNEFRRLLVRGEVKNVYAWGTVREKRNATDLHRKLIRWRPPARRGAVQRADVEPVEPDRKIMKEVGLGPTHAEVPDARAGAIDVMIEADRRKIARKFLADDAKNFPESRRAVEGARVLKLTPEQVVERVFPGRIFKEPFEERLKKVEQIIEHDRKNGAMQLGKSSITAPILLGE